MIYRRLKADKKGFLLLEIMVSLVVITTGVLFVIRSYSSSKNAIERSDEVIRVFNLMENRFWELEDRGEIEEGVQDGGFEEDASYSWRISASRIEDSKLNQVVLDVYKKGDMDAPGYSASTYLKKIKPNEER